MSSHCNLSFKSFWIVFDGNHTYVANTWQQKIIHTKPTHNLLSAYLTPYFPSVHRPPLWQWTCDPLQVSGFVKFLAPQVHSPMTSTRTPTSAVLLALTIYGNELTSSWFVQLPSQFTFSCRHSSIPTMVMLISTSFSIWELNSKEYKIRQKRANAKKNDEKNTWRLITATTLDF